MGVPCYASDGEICYFWRMLGRTSKRHRAMFDRLCQCETNPRSHPWTSLFGGCKGRSHSPCRYPCGDPHPALAHPRYGRVDIASARGRVLATDLVAKVNLPHWDSAAVDGFAVRGPDLVPDRINEIDSDRRGRSRPPVCWRPRPWTSRWNPHWRSTSGWCRGNRCGHAPARAGRRTSWCPGLQSAAGAPATFRARAQLRHDL